MDNETELDLYVYPGKRFAKNGLWLGDGQGMSLRDYFAIEALKGIGDWTPWPQGVSSLQQGDPRIDLRTVEAQRARAAWAYSQADAMLAEREDG